VSPSSGGQKVADGLRESKHNPGLSPNRLHRPWVKRLGVTIFGLLLLSLVLPYAAGISFVYYPAELFSVLNIVFVGLIGLAVSWIAARSYLKTGQIQMAWLGGGVLAFALGGGLLAPLIQSYANASTATHNVSALLGGLLHVVGALFMFRALSKPPEHSSRTAALLGIYGISVVLVILVMVFSIQGAMPVFRVPGVGGTLLRAAVLNSAIAAYCISGLILLVFYFRNRANILFWYSLGLLLIALSLFASLHVIAGGDFFSWLNRLSQYAGSTYLVIAVATALRNAHTRQAPIEEIVAEFGRKAKLNFELLVNAASDAMISVDEFGRILMWNPAAERMFGYGQGEVIGKPFFDLLRGIEDSTAFKKASNAEDVGRPAVMMELTGKRKDGIEFPVELTLAAKDVSRGWIPTTTTLITRDISERKKAEEALRASEESLRSLAENVPCVLMRFDRQLRVIYLSKHSDRYNPNPSEQMLGRTNREMGMPEHLCNLWDAATERVFNTGIQEEMEFDFAGPSGMRTFTLKFAPEFGPKREIQYVLGVSTDITERRKSEEELQRSNRKISEILSSIREDFYVLDRDWVFVYANRQFTSRIGKEPEDFVGKNIWEMFPKHLGTLYEENLRAAMEKRETRHFEVGGKYTDAWYSMAVFPSAEGVTILGTDITERRKSEAALAYRATFPELNPNPIVELDAAGKIIYMNPAATALFPNLPKLGIMHPYLAGWHVLAGEIKSEDIKYRTRDARVGDYWYEQVIARVPSSSNFRISGRDITVRKKTEELKDEFIGMVSHELKTPLTVIMGSLATVTDEGITGEDTRELLESAVTYTGILANMVDNLLELSRQQSDRLVLSTKAVDLREAVQSVLRNLHTKSDIHQLVDDLPQSLAPAQADPLRLERILYNLVDNAIKYSSNGGEVKVTARQNGDFLTIAVSDQGPGISADDQARLFQSFERLGASVKGAIQGTGLGLRVCRILVEAHGGTIWVESEKGKGSSFIFTLPIMKHQTN